ncbi:uncharacterized protein, partial [Eurosta solidaginis]|uniref:uncharacterized protein n=1 Tax=Eurosta solidaginis TaxID=178769 RepID=UPI00353139B0
MVVILLLSPPPPTTPQEPYATTTTTNGCDAGSPDSSTVSTTSTGDTVIPTIYTDNKTIPLPNEATYQHYQPPQPPATAAKAHQQQHQHQQHHHHHKNQQQLTPHEYDQQRKRHCHQQRTHAQHGRNQRQTKPFNTTTQNSSHLLSEKSSRNISEREQRTSNVASTKHEGRVYKDQDTAIFGKQYPPRVIVSPPLPPSPTLPTEIAVTEKTRKKSTGVPRVIVAPDSSSSKSPPPARLPPLPNSQTPSSCYYNCWFNGDQQQQQQLSFSYSHHLCTNPLPKPPRMGATYTSNISYDDATHRRSRRHTTATTTAPQTRWSIPPSQEPNTTNRHWSHNIVSEPAYHSLPQFPYSAYIQQSPPDNSYYYDYNNNNNNNTNTNTTDFVRHVTRVNFYDVVT